MGFNGIGAENFGLFTAIAFAVANKTLLPALSAYSVERSQRTIKLQMRKLTFIDGHSLLFYLAIMSLANKLINLESKRKYWSLNILLDRRQARQRVFVW
jgi:hypothetical protein